MTLSYTTPRGWSDEQLQQHLTRLTSDRNALPADSPRRQVLSSYIDNLLDEVLVRRQGVVPDGQ